jgi:alpha-D-ribose 1-methylphosphonate 5-triphosphate synthase subunit PhnH
MITTAEFREAQFDPLEAADELVSRVREATARPGLVVDLGDLELTVPPPRLRAACALLLALMDDEVSFHVLGPDAGRLRSYLRFHTGARPTALADADFVLVTQPAGTGGAGVSGLRDGATVVCPVRGLSNTVEPADLVLCLDGQHASDGRWLAIQGVRRVDLAPALEQRAFDVWLVAADGRLAVLPRTVGAR